ncbi:Protein-L-isoaspartate O-methyltransferase [hydrothermal vent metagenome]|uniref:Protein-L-isoaspartate O-methyltransferase n=1 Tax=hydrothermal vent metagenome TaxID=652676 RepID=A0A3B0UAX0_9ZZZZ
MIDFLKARTAMIESQLQTSGVFNARVLEAFLHVPREVFVDKELRQFAYVDRELKLPGSAKRFMGAPAPVARLIELAEIEPDDIVLDVACGTGYSTAIIAHLANSVVAIESDDKLVALANENLAELDIGNAAVIKAPLAKGAPDEAPFDVIIIQGALSEVPKALFDQLRLGGRLVALIGKGGSATAMTYVKSETGIAAVASFNAFLPELEELAHAPEFAF